jgi:succinyl-CoA:acetate CoA-transferase
MVTERIRYAPLRSRIITPEQAAERIRDGMVVGLSGFTRSGDAKIVPMALVEKVKREQQKLKIDVYTGASLG